MQTEKRSFDFKEFRAIENDDGKIIEGHAAVFGEKADIGGHFFEMIDKGAFDGCDLSDVALFINHSVNSLPLARTTSGTLELSIDNIGLAIRAKLDIDNPDAKALYSAVKRRDCGGMSFSFHVVDEEWQDCDSDMPTRIIKKISRVYEVSIANYPAYHTTNIDARTMETLANFNKKELAKMSFEEFMKQFKDADERTATVNASRGLFPDGVTPIPSEYRDMIPAKYYPVSTNKKDMSNFIRSAVGFVPSGEKSTFINNQPEHVNQEIINRRVQAGQDLKENRAVQSEFNILGERRTITVEPSQGESASIVVPNFSSATINPDFPVVSSLIDSVAYFELPGGESFQQPYVTGIDVGSYGTEGANAAQAETHFDFANINRCKIGAYAELTDELKKLPAAAYADTVFQNIRVSMRQLIAHEILWGKGVENDQSRIVGIFSDRAFAIDAASDISISQITDTTLDEIIFKYGGDEAVEDPAVLILSKADLLAFSKVRTSTKQKFYDIQFTGGNTGRINGISFIIDSNCKPLASSSTLAGEYCMAYGGLKGYQLVSFSPVEVVRSDDFKFRQGITCFKGSAFVGGNCVKKNAFLRVKKSA